MSEAKFILRKKILLQQLKKLKKLGLEVSYSYKTNNQVGDVLQKISDIEFSVHTHEDLDKIKQKKKTWFFLQAESKDQLKDLLSQGVKNFVVDNEIDLQNLLQIITQEKKKINLSIRMKFQEHRVGTGKYFVYGLSAKKVNKLILELDTEFIENLGIHIHRKSQNTSEWEIREELEDSLDPKTLEKITILNLGGGLPTEYKSYKLGNYKYIFDKIKSAVEFLQSNNIKTYIEPGRFLAAPCVDLETEIIQIQGKNIIINTSVYYCALDTILTGTKLLVKGEEQGTDFYLIKGNSPTRDDIFRYKVSIKNPKVGDKIIFLNAGAYNYTTDFFGYKKLKTIIKE